MNLMEQLKKRLNDLAEKAYNEGIYTYSRFLTPEEQAVFISAKKELPPVGARLFGGNDSCIRKIVIFGSAEEFGYDPDPPLRIIRISPLSEKYAGELTHRDYLGALMGLGIDRGVTGDIIIRGKTAWVFVLDTAAEFIINELRQVGRTNVKCEPEEGDAPDIKPRFENITANIASERLDLIISALTKVKRDSAAKLIKDGRVFLNGTPAASPGHRIKEGDTIVIRGAGKYIYDGIGGTTKKGRININARKYI